MTLMESFLSKYVIFYENGPNLTILGGQNDAISQNLGKVVKKSILPKFKKKKFLGGSIWLNLTKNVIKWAISAKICIFGCFPYIS